MLRYPESRYDPVWTALQPYWRVRRNNVHIPLSFMYVRRLLAAYPDADEDICVLALMLHDVGWHCLDGPDLIERAFAGPNFMHSDERYLHETEGCRIAREVLPALGWDGGVVDEVCKIIDGHDTRQRGRYLNDWIVRDADKLWRFSAVGIVVCCEWFKQTPAEYADRLARTTLAQLETEAGRSLAAEELASAWQLLKVGLV